MTSQRTLEPSLLFGDTATHNERLPAGIGDYVLHVESVSKIHAPQH